MNETLKPFTGQVWLTLARIDIGETTFCFVNNSTDIVHNGQTYFARNFRVEYPQQTEGRSQNVRLRLDFVDREVSQYLRENQDDMSVTLTPIVASDPDAAQLGPYRLKIVSVSNINPATLSIDLAHLDILNIPAHRMVFSPSLFPAMFTKPGVINIGE